MNTNMNETGLVVADSTLFLKELELVQNQFHENKQPIPQFIEGLVTDLLNANVPIDSVSVYVKMIIQSVGKEKQACHDSANRAIIAHYQRKLNDTVEFLKTKNAELIPNIRALMLNRVLNYLSILGIRDGKLKSFVVKVNEKNSTTHNAVPIEGLVAHEYVTGSFLKKDIDRIVSYCENGKFYNKSKKKSKKRRK